MDKSFFSSIFLDAIQPLKEEKAFLDRNGFLKVKAKVTRAGVYDYEGYIVGSTAKVEKVFRSPEEVFSEKSMNSLKMIPATQNHPTVGNLNPMTSSGFVVGSTGEKVERTEDDHLMASLSVYDSNCIENILNNNSKSISMGCYASIIPEKGEYDGIKYNFAIKNIQYNHAAILLPDEEPRGGESCQILLDSKPKFYFLNQNEKKNMENVITKKVLPQVKLGETILDSISIEENESTSKLEKRCEKLIEQCNDLEKQISEKQAMLDSSSEELKSLQEKNKDSVSRSELNKMVQERVGLVKKCEESGIEFKDSVSNTELKLALCDKVGGFNKEIRERFTQGTQKDSDLTYLDSYTDISLANEKKWDEVKQTIQSRNNLERSSGKPNNQDYFYPNHNDNSLAKY